VPISVNLNLGSASATAWGCDLSEEYVLINSEYMT
jgi:glutamate N-acetyltransferase/amino-acid N-acetyltransferase